MSELVRSAARDGRHALQCPTAHVSTAESVAEASVTKRQANGPLEPQRGALRFDRSTTRWPSIEPLQGHVLRPPPGARARGTARARSGAALQSSSAPTRAEGPGNEAGSRCWRPWPMSRESPAASGPSPGAPGRRGEPFGPALNCFFRSKQHASRARTRSASAAAQVSVTKRASSRRVGPLPSGAGSSVSAVTPRRLTQNVR